VIGGQMMLDAAIMHEFNFYHYYRTLMYMICENSWWSRCYGIHLSNIFFKNFNCDWVLFPPHTYLVKIASDFINSGKIFAWSGDYGDNIEPIVVEESRFFVWLCRDVCLMIDVSTWVDFIGDIPRYFENSLFIENSELSTFIEK
jgi:hypothetical protein